MTMVGHEDEQRVLHRAALRHPLEERAQVIVDQLAGDISKPLRKIPGHRRHCRDYSRRDA